MELRALAGIAPLQPADLKAAGAETRRGAEVGAMDEGDDLLGDEVDGNDAAADRGEVQHIVVFLHRQHPRGAPRAR